MKIIISTKTLICVALLGVALLVGGFILGYRIFPMIVSKKVWENTVLQEGTRQWELFKKIPFPFQTRIYLFNVENVDQIMQGAKPIVKEVGPYVYRLYRWKDDIEWNDDEISYYQYTKYEFDPLASGKLSDNDYVTILNTAYNALLLAVEELSPSALATVNDVLPDVLNEYNSLFIKVKVKDLLFEGIQLCKPEDVEDFAARMICNQFKNKAKIAKGMELVDGHINYSLLKFKNNTHLGRFTINSGLKTKEDVSNIVLFNNQSQISVWPNKTSICNEIKATTTFRPYVTREMTFDVFSEDICRRLKMAFDKVEIVKGIEGYKFAVTNDSFNTPRENSDNYCYCVNRSRTLNGEFGCLNDGLLDLSNCVGGPMLLSFPHLLYGSKEYLNSVEGIHPNKSIHDTYAILEPTSGTPLKVAQRVQFNMFIRALDDITSIENVTNALVPIVWLEEIMILPDGFIDLIKSSLLNNLHILEIVKWGIIAVGGCAIVIPAAVLIYRN